MNIFRYYNQNRKKIWLVIIAIIMLIIAIQAINEIVKKQINEKNMSINKIDEEEYKNNLNINVLISEEEVDKEEELIIDQFIRCCNAKKLEEAYELLTDKCKEELFTTIEEFKQNYYNIYFSDTKLYSKEKFLADTYKINLYGDILSTGNSRDSVEDYYTIVRKDGKVKLNISNYIGQEIINEDYKNDNLQIKILDKQIYKEYEEYQIQAINLSDNTILLDSKESTKTMYLEGKNNVKYYSRPHEISKQNLIIRPNAGITFLIKYSKEYNSNKTVNRLIFSDIIMDYDLYLSKEKKSEYQDRESIRINV